MNDVPIDPAVLALLAELDPPPGVPAAEQTAEQLRRTMRANNAVFTRGVDQIELRKVTDELVRGQYGDIPVRIYRPDDPTAAVVYYHGGAWIVGDLDTHDLVTRRISRDTGALVVSVDYRMLPEHPFPAPFDDAWDATVWARDLLPGKPFLVAGDSAGGTLAACVALRARDEGGPAVDGQVLIYPGVDKNYGSPSMLRYAEDELRANLRFYIEGYASTEAGLASPYALPGLATSLAGLPPAIVAIAGNDPLRSSNEEYALRLATDGVPVTVQLDPELVHAWVEFAGRVPSADRAFTRLTDAVNELIEP
ncbi:alpha/beta hydrolase [Kribbella sp. HUAS MG21]|uniref:Alpha/beta hydrolase n=1 Tax=Kribbella sp. HUAS MG21 TaxID=3160966 RepID=A0AAU7TEG8_9ACTN